MPSLMKKNILPGSTSVTGSTSRITSGQITSGAICLMLFEPFSLISLHRSSRDETLDWVSGTVTARNVTEMAAHICLLDGSLSLLESGLESFITGRIGDPYLVLIKLDVAIPSTEIISCRTMPSNILQIFTLLLFCKIDLEYSHYYDDCNHWRGILFFHVLKILVCLKKHFLVFTAPFA